MFVETVDRNGDPVSVGRVAKNVKVPLQVVRDDGTEYQTEQDIGGWGAVHPNALKTKPKETKGP